MAKFGKDPIYRTKDIVRKPVDARPPRQTQSHNTARLGRRAYTNQRKEFIDK